MAWFKLDDGFFHHPKVVQAGRDARDLWLAAGCYCAKELTDGFVPPACLPLLAAEAQVSGPTKLAARLVAAGLFEERDGGYAIHDYLAYNPSRASVLAERARVNEVRAAAGRLGGLRSGAVRRRQAVAAQRVPGHPVGDAPLATSAPADAKQTGSKPESKREANHEAKAKQNGSPVPLPHGMPASMASCHETETMAEPTHADSANRRARAGPFYGRDFEAFWALYPRHDSKKKSAEEYRRRLRAGRSPAQLEAAAEHFSRSHEAQGTPTSKIPYAVTWLQGGRDEQWEHGDPDAGRVVADPNPERYFPDYRSSAQKALEPRRAWRQTYAPADTQTTESGSAAHEAEETSRA